MYIEEANEAEISGVFRLTALNKTKSKDLDNTNGKTPLIIKKIWVFPNLAGILPFIVHPQGAQHSVITVYLNIFLYINLQVKMKCILLRCTGYCTPKIIIISPLYQQKQTSKLPYNLKVILYYIFNVCDS